MRARIDWARIAGLALHILIGGLLILTGSQKIFGSAPPEALVKFGLGENARLIGAGAILTALLLLVPRTASLGLLLTSAFWGGTMHDSWDGTRMLQERIRDMTLRTPGSAGSMSERSTITSRRS